MTIQRSRNDRPARRIVLVNQASNYLTIGFANAFKNKFDEVVLITGSVHEQGESLQSDVVLHRINQWYERPSWKKLTSYVVALARMWWLLVFRYRNYDVLFVSVPPFGYLLNLVLPHRFSMVIWDVYPDTLKVTGMAETHVIYRIWSKLNRRSFAKAYRVFTISDGMADSIAQYMDRADIVVHPIWSIFQENCRISRAENRFVDTHGLSGKFVVQYSGNIGVTHNVEVLLEIAKELVEDKEILFQVIGRGPRLPYIEKLVNQNSLHNIQFLPFQSDEEFPYSLSAADLGVVILHEAVGFGSVPSKAYNLMSFGIPSLYIASRDSELARYSERYGHAMCFASNEVEEASDFVRRIATDSQLAKQMHQNAENASSNFRRSNADRFVTSYLDQ